LSPARDIARLQHDLDRHVVTAVLVTHDGARWLPETLKALLTQTRPVQRLVAVDTESHDRCPAVLTEVVGAGNLLSLPRTSGYGEAIAEALRHPAASIAVPSDRPVYEQALEQEARVEWIWLLHDDSAPAHDALDRLLNAVESDPHIGVLGPKLRDWTDRRVLLEIGVSIDGFGRRETGVERRELDQGQHDGLRDVLAVSTAGMLVRRDIWDQLGGFDVALGLFRDDIDFCWRAHAEGHRVVAVTDAVVFHVEASARQQRELGVTADHPRRLDRRNALFVLLTNLPLRAMLRAVVRNLVGSLIRALALLIAKRPSAAKDELAAVGDVLRDLSRLRRGRAARAHNRKRVYRSVRRFMARRVVLRRLGEWLAALLSGDFIGAHHGRSEEDEPIVPETGPLRRFLTSPGVVVVLILTAVSLVAERSLVATGGRLGGGALVPAWGGAAELWKQYLSGWHPTGLGSDTGSPPYVGVLALLSTVLLGKPWLAVGLLLLGCVPLAGLTAYVAAHTLVPDTYSTLSERRTRNGRRVPAPVVRAWLAGTYALLPVATGAVAGGRLGTAVVIVLLPLIGLLVARMLGLPRSSSADAGETRALRVRRARRAAWGAGLLLTVAMAFAPLTWLLALVIGTLMWVAFGPSGSGTRGRGGRRGLGTNLAIALGVPPLLLLPWTFGLLLHPSRFLLEAGLHRPELVDSRLAAKSIFLLDPGGPGTPAWWVTAGLVAAGLLALPLRSRRMAVLAGWMLALFGLLGAILVSAATVTGGSQGADTARAWPSVAVLFAAGGIVLAATAAVQRAAEVLVGKDLIYRAGGALVALAALSTPLLAAGSWIVTGVPGPLGEVGPDVVPAFIGATASGAVQPRTLVLTQGPGQTQGRVVYTVLRGSAPMLGESETPTSAAAAGRMKSLVGELAAGHGDGHALARMGIQFVLVPRPEKDPLTPVMDAAPDLARLSRTSGFALWRLVPSAGRLMLLEGQTVTPLPVGETGGTVRIPAGGPGRTLLLAEPADGGWHATLDGSSVRSRVVDGWAQGYDVPAAGGRFELSHGMWWRHFWLIVQALAVAFVAVLALPGSQTEEGTGAALEAVRGWRRPRGRRSRVSDEPGPPNDGEDKSENEGDGTSGGSGEVSRPAGARRGRRRKAGGPDEPKADPVSGSGGSGEQGDLSESSAPVEPVEPVDPKESSESSESSEEVGA
jgi:GT2 family glycosyltransferase